jgi:hypothetical protein
MPAQQERLLRYRFDSVAQARKHLHPIESRQLLFFPDRFLQVQSSQPIQLELWFTGSEQTITVRGRVHSVEKGQLCGAWLDLFSLRVLDGMHVATESPRRHARRLSTDMMIVVERPGQPPSMGRLVDVSASGARIVGATGRWSPGDELVISEIHGAPLRGHISRSGYGEIAVEFSREDAMTRRTAVKMMTSALQRWADARETHHPAACACMNGGELYEPIAPRSARRRVENL